MEGKLYVNITQNGPFVKKATSPATTSGNSVTLTANSLNEYTNYYYYVTVSDGKGNPVQGTVQGPIKTYCPGNTYTCDGPFYGTTRCYECGGCGKHTMRVVNSGFLSIQGRSCSVVSCRGIATGYQEGVCTKCGTRTTNYSCGIISHELRTGDTVYCGICMGSGTTTGSKRCRHGYYSSHEYCTHDYTYQHD